MKSEISENSKKEINNKLFLKFVSFNSSNKKDSNKTIALSNFFNKDGDRILDSKKNKTS